MNATWPQRQPMPTHQRITLAAYPPLIIWFLFDHEWLTAVLMAVIAFMYFAYSLASREVAYLTKLILHATGRPIR